ncbi:adenosylcobinamide-phosphate synthase CbiB [Taklimakanibacter deserti]|uniref:adenosylcobinamide-phosphate synthase CbiB n=1 Tax=Taklimakanibacter deserti TaxID=2267839 RepID=UPI000E65CE1A
MFFATTALALLIERFIGYPDILVRTIGHPVQWIGAFIAWLDARLNPESEPGNRLAGMLALLALLVVTGGLALAVALALRKLPYGWVAEAIIATPFLAQKSLAGHVRAVADGLDRSLAEGRSAVSRIVGRDPEQLDRSGVARAALESLGENASDGIVAPAFWLALLGLPGIALYKAINTADSMIGHRSPRYLAFGWAAARLDDLVNLPCARLTGLLFALAAYFSSRTSAKAAFAAMRRDAHRHVSPNAGWPESALAGALGVKLGGPRAYGGRHVDLATMGDGKSELDANDIRDGLSLYGDALSLLAVIAVLLALAF